MDRGELLQSDRKRPDLVVVQRIDQRSEEVVPGIEELEQAHRRDRRLRNPDDDVPHDLELVRAVHPCGVEVLDGLAHRDAGCPVRPRRDPAVHLVGPRLRSLSQDPTDGLPDEELGLIEHRVRAAREWLEESTVLQRRQFCEQRRPSDPEVVVASPPIQRASDAKVQSHLPDHVAGEDVHQRPRPRLADQSLDQPEVP